MDENAQQVIKTDSLSGALDTVRSMLHESWEGEDSVPVQQIDVLVTGSLHLVGGMLTCMAPEEVN